MTGAPTWEVIADELYGLAPEYFIAARTDAERAARGTDPALALKIRGLGKPNLAAWLANQLTRRSRSELESFLALGPALRAATAAGDGEQLRQLALEQRQAEQVLLAGVRAVAAEHDRRVSEETLRAISGTLHAGLVAEPSAEALLDGRLVQPLRLSGLGDEADVLAIPAVRSGRSSRPALRLLTGGRAGSDSSGSDSSPASAGSDRSAAAPVESRNAATESAAARRAAEALERARSDAEVAFELRDDLARELEHADHITIDLRERVAELKLELEQTQHELIAAERDERRLRQRHDRADLVLQKAVRVLHRLDTGHATASRPQDDDQQDDDLHHDQLQGGADDEGADG